MFLTDGWNDLRSSHGIHGHVGDGRSRDMPQISHGGSNLADDNSFLGHEVGAWKGSDTSWRGDDLNRTLTPQPVNSGPLRVMDTQQDSFRIVGSEPIFTTGDRNWKAPVHDEFFRNSRDPQYYQSRQQQSFADMRPSDGRDQTQGADRLLNGSGGRYPAMYDTGPGVCLTRLNMLTVECCMCNDGILF